MKDERWGRIQAKLLKANGLGFLALAVALKGSPSPLESAT